MTQNIPEMTARFISLTPEQAARYDDIKRVVQNIMRDPDGLMYLLNTLALTGDTTLGTVQAWVDIAFSGRLDSRDLAGVVYERPLSLPELTLPDL